MLNTQRISANSNTFRTSEPKNGQKRRSFMKLWLSALTMVLASSWISSWSVSWSILSADGHGRPPIQVINFGHQLCQIILGKEGLDPNWLVVDLPLWKILVKWEYEIPQYMESHKIHVPNHQPALGKEGLDPNLVSPLKDPRCCNAKLRPCSLPGWHWWLGICSPWLVVVGLLLF